MTNLEYMIANLKAIKEDSPLVDDGGSSEEAFVYYNIPCPYTVGDERAHFVIYSRDGYQPHQYKGCSLEIVSNLDYVAVAYFNIRTGKLHDIREIKEETT